jgi:hypothetical protein
MYGIDDPSNLLQPWKNLKQFTEELYGMFKASAAAPAEAAPGRAAQPAAPDSKPAKPRDDPASIGIGGTRKQRLASIAQTLPSVSVAGGASSPAGRARTQQAEDQSPRRESGSVVPFEPIASLSSSPRPPAPAAPAPRAAQPTPDNIGDHSSEPRQAFSQTGNFDLAPLAPAFAAFKSRAARVNAPAPPAQDQPLPGATKKADVVKVAEPIRPQEAAPNPEPDRASARARDRLKPVLDIGDFATPPSGGGTSGTTVFIGKVDSGTGDTYQVFLYQAGPTGQPDSSPVTVTIPMIDPTDTIPSGTWLNPIFQFPAPSDQFGDAGTGFIYSCQPPVWMP